MKKGFTLVELLAVIVILAVISIITIPFIGNTIETAKKSAAIESVNGILDAADKYLIQNIASEKLPTSFDLSSDNKLNYKGAKPESGTLLVDKEGKMSITVSTNGYCVRKRFNEITPTIIEETCEIEDKEIINSIEQIAINKSNNNCVTDNTKTCSKEEIISGLEVSVNVNDNENYDFYVINDNGDTLDLQINFNIGTSAWSSNDDYKKVTGSDCIFENGCNDYGPITLLKNLKEKTNDWSNVLNQTDILNYASNQIDLSSYKARIIRLTEAIELGCKSYKSDGTTNDTCPLWFGTNYYTLSSVPHSSVESHSQISYWIYRNAHNTSFVTSVCGFRPVITISKSMIK